MNLKLDKDATTWKATKKLKLTELKHLRPGQYSLTGSLWVYFDQKISPLLMLDFVPEQYLLFYIAAELWQENNILIRNISSPVSLPSLAVPILSPSRYTQWIYLKMFPNWDQYSALIILFLHCSYPALCWMMNVKTGHTVELLIAEPWQSIYSAYQLSRHLPLLSASHSDNTGLVGLFLSLSLVFTIGI